jgi:hypothetical protein
MRYGLSSPVMLTFNIRLADSPKPVAEDIVIEISKPAM